MRKTPNPRELLIALLCGLPVSFMVACGLPWMLVASLAMLISSPTISAFYGVAFVAACLLAIVTYWRLALVTALQRPYTFGPMFWLATLCAFYVAVEVSGWFSGIQSLLLLIGPPVGSAIYFSILQCRGFTGEEHAC